ncbi:MAG TPA: aquaporin [Oligoflexia bacterium]|nr:aquaporin [Oligoflexia bacterium]
MKNLMIEALGAFFLTLVVGLNILVAKNGQFAPFAIGLTLMVIVYAGGPISGGHYNPLVSIAVWIRGALRTRDVLPYISSQFLGASLAFFPVSFLVPHEAVSATNTDLAQIFAAEYLFSFLLAITVILCATNKSISGNSFFGIAIGTVLTISALSVGGISGAVLNPAVGFSLLIFNVLNVSVLPTYFAAQLLAGVSAGFLGRFLFDD